MKFINFPCRAWNEKSETEKGNQTVITAIPISPCFHSLNTSELLLIFFVIEAAPILHRCLNKIGIMEAIPNVVADDFPNIKVIGTKRPSSNSLNTQSLLYSQMGFGSMGSPGHLSHRWWNDFEVKIGCFSAI